MGQMVMIFLTRWIVTVKENRCIIHTFSTKKPLPVILRASADIFSSTRNGLHWVCLIIIAYPYTRVDDGCKSGAIATVDAIIICLRDVEHMQLYEPILFW